MSLKSTCFKDIESDVDEPGSCLDALSELGGAGGCDGQQKCLLDMRF